MANGNTLTLVGNATRDPELRFTPSGQAVASFGLAWNNRWQDRTTQEWQEKVHFFDVTCWAQLAENVSETVQKGTRVVVFGRLDQQQWETDAGDKRNAVKVLADSVAVDLRYATAAVVKNERRGGPQGGDAGADQYGGEEAY